MGDWLVKDGNDWGVDDDPPYSPWRGIYVTTSSVCVLLPWWTILIIVVVIIVIIGAVVGFFWRRNNKRGESLATEESHELGRQ